VADKGVPTVRVIDPSDDPGTRLTESEFLAELANLAH
jgi:hypothetical protein